MSQSIPVLLRKTCVFFVLWSYFALLLVAFFSPWIVFGLAAVFAGITLIAVTQKANQWERQVAAAYRVDSPIPGYLNYSLDVFCHYYGKPTPKIITHRTNLIIAAIKARGLTGYELVLSESFLKSLKREEQLAILERTIINFDPARLRIFTERVKWGAFFSLMTKRLMDRVQFWALLFFYPLSRITLSFLVVDPKKKAFEPALYSPEAIAQRRAKLENERALRKLQSYEWSEFIVWPEPSTKKEVDPEFIPWLISSFRHYKTKVDH